MNWNIFGKSAPVPGFKQKLKNITYVKPRNVKLYKTAFTHKNYAYENNVESNEKLEYLGDSILSTIISIILYRKFPNGDEGLLTEMRSKIVNRKTLNAIGTQMGLQELIRVPVNQKIRNNSNIIGNVLEALIGAIYVDQGFSATQSFVVNCILKPHLNLDELVNQVHSHKNLVLNWAAQNNEVLSFDDRSLYQDRKKYFEVRIYDSKNQLLGKAVSKSKKEASQLASELAIDFLKSSERWR